MDLEPALRFQFQPTSPRDLAKDLEYLSTTSLDDSVDEVARLLGGYVRTLQTRSSS
jgi:hypothetical protein